MTYYYSRMKGILLGCAGVTAVAFIGLYVAIQRMPKPTLEGKPCIQWSDATRPLAIGDTARFVMRSVDVSDCTGKPPRGFTWSSLDPAILEMTEDGLARGKSAGVFTVSATRDTTTLTASGFVLPGEWQPRIEPDSATLRVGDSVAMVIRPFDKSGAALPEVPYSIFAPEFFEPTTRKTPIVNKYSWQNVVDPSVVVATDTGTTILVGRIGPQQVMSKLTIRPRE